MTEDRQQLRKEIDARFQVCCATNVINEAAFEMARADYLRAPAPAFHRYVTAKVDHDGRIVNLAIADEALAGYDHIELSQIVTDVLRRSGQHVSDALKEQNDEFARGVGESLDLLSELVRLDRSAAPLGCECPVHHSDELDSIMEADDPEPKCYEEQSCDGDLGLAIAASGELLFCRIGASAVDQFLAGRIVRLHSAALARAERDFKPYFIIG